MLAEQGIASEAYDPIYHPDMAYKNKQYDLIASVEVFEHLHDPMTVFGELVSSLRPGGMLAIRTEFFCSDREAYLQWYYRRDPTHVVFFSPQTFRVMCERASVSYMGDNRKNIVLIGI
jgi:SAM-dependent methyltransferase